MSQAVIIPAAGELARASRSTLDTCVAAWLHAKHQRTRSEKTRRAYADTLASFREVLQRAGLDLDGDPGPLALLAQGWAARGEPSPATFNQRLAILSSFYAYAARHEFLPGPNPIDKVARRPVQAYAGARALDPAEVKRRLAAIDRGELQGKRDYALLAIALQTGRRLSELAALQWGDVTIADGRRVTLTFRRTKGGKLMADTLPAAVGRALLAYLHALHGAALGTLAADQPLWVSLARNGTAGQGLGIRSVGDICKKHLGTSKVHTLRHTFARAMEEAGAKVSDIQARLGHESLATTGRYLAALKAADNPHGERLAALFGLGED